MKLANIGALTYINTYPVDWALRRSPLKSLVNLVFGTPADMNRLLISGALDIAPISSVAAAAHSESLQIFDSWCIASPGAVGSVILASKIPVAALGAKTIAVAAESATSVKLLEVLLKDYWKVDARFVGAGSPHNATLAIGDTGLRLNHSNTYAYRYDLGAEWKKFTGKGFVYGLWCVRKAFLMENEECCAALGRLFHLSAFLGRSEYFLMVESASRRLKLPLATIRDYLDNLDFRMDANLSEGFSLFLNRLGIDPSDLEMWNSEHESLRTGERHGI